MAFSARYLSFLHPYTTKPHLSSSPGEPWPEAQGGKEANQTHWPNVKLLLGNRPTLSFSPLQGWWGEENFSF